MVVLHYQSSKQLVVLPPDTVLHFRHLMAPPLGCQVVNDEKADMSTRYSLPLFEISNTAQV